MIAGELTRDPPAGDPEAAPAQLPSWTAVAAGLLLLLTAVPALLRPGAFLQDDAYFYLQIAHQIVTGHGSTFHGVTPTNGYQPLWMPGAVLAAWLARGDKMVALHLTIALQVLLSVGVALLLDRLVRRIGLGFPLVAVAVFLSYLFGVGIFASEAHLNALLLTAGILALWQALVRDERRWWVTTGLVMGLAVLARLDNLFVVSALMGLGALQDSKSHTARAGSRALLAFSGIALIVAPYLLLNWLQYGHVAPISDAIKSTFPTFDFGYRRLGSVGRLVVPCGVLALGIGLFVDRDRRRRVLWCGLGAGVVLHALYACGFTDYHNFWAWYYVPGVLAVSLLAAYLPSWLMDRLRPGHVRSAVPPLVLLLTLVVLAAGAGRAWLKAFNPISIGSVTIDLPINDYRWPEEFAQWMKRHLPPQSLVLAYDYPGALAYYSDLAILPMDGRVSDFAYNEDLLAAGPTRYLCSRGVSYYFGEFEDAFATQDIVIPAPLLRRAAGTLSLRGEQVIASTRDAVARPDEALPFALWKLDCP